MIGTYHRAIDADMKERIADVRHRIAEAATRSGRQAGDVRLVAVSKTVTRAAVNLAFQLGLREFGENRVDDALEKFETMPEGMILHMIGPFRDERAADVIGRFSLIHSVDRSSLLDALDQAASNADVEQDILLQVNIAGEEQKHGCEPGELGALIEHAMSKARLSVRGLMAMAPFLDDAEDARPYFAQLRDLRDSMRSQFPDCDLSHLSMGMTNDYEVAVEEGATIVRVGRAIFHPVRGS